MQLLNTSMQAGFDVIGATERAQAATMVLEAGSSTGGPENRHRGSNQWMYVVEGSGKAVVEGLKVELQPGTLLLIEPGEQHEIRAAATSL